MAGETCHHVIQSLLALKVTFLNFVLSKHCVNDVSMVYKNTFFYSCCITYMLTVLIQNILVTLALNL